MKVLITRKIPAKGINLLKENGLELDYRQGPPLSHEELLNATQDVDALLAVIPDKINEDIVNSAQNLKIIATYSVGYDHIDVESATQKGIWVSNTPGDVTKLVAEHTIGLMLAISKNLVSAHKFVVNGEYEYWDPLAFLGQSLFDKNVGIIGMGRIGFHVGTISKGLGMNNIFYNDLNVNQMAEEKLAATKLDLNSLLETCDYVSLNCNLCEETRHLLDTPEFEIIKPGAVIINTSRGPVINEEALVGALKSGQVAGAGLDVFEHEPQVHPDLLNMDNVVLTPHIASSTLEGREEMAVMAAQNIVDVLINNKSPTYPVNQTRLV